MPTYIPFSDHTLSFPSSFYPTASSPATDVAKQYRVTVSGTVSFWPDQVGTGVDGVYAYDVPAGETPVNWPWGVPTWLGDPAEFVAGVSLNNTKGFKIDGEPLPDTGVAGDHTYEIIVDGTGAPFLFAFLDLNYVEGSLLDYSEDNSGSVTVVVEEVVPDVVPDEEDYPCLCCPEIAETTEVAITVLYVCEEEEG